ILAELHLEGASIAEIVHGTTVATNAILEYTGARTALLTTRGFRDVLELRRVRAPELYNPFYRPPRPLVERSLCFEIPERTAPNGEEFAAVGGPGRRWTHEPACGFPLCSTLHRGTIGRRTCEGRRSSRGTALCART